MRENLRQETDIHICFCRKERRNEQISAIFTETADNEKEHAKRFFKFLEGGDLEITATYPAGKIGTTLENLQAAAAGENEEHTILYPEFAKVAEQEGFDEIASVYKFISTVEAEHERRYLALAANVKNAKVFKKDSSIKWRCRNCGYVYNLAEAVDLCPACAHPKAYQEVAADNY